MHNQSEWRDWLVYGNLPDKRWRIRRAKTGRDKQLLRLDREGRKIHNAIWDLGYEDLVPPIQRGWKRTFVLREDVMHDKRAEFYQNILNKINTVQTSWRKDFKVKKRRLGKRTYVVKEQQLKELGSFDKSFSDEEKSLFYKKEEYNFYSKKTVIKYVFLEQWRFVLKVQPNMITKVRRHDWELERREEEIEDYLKRNNRQERLHKLYGYRSYHCYYWDKRLCVKEKHKNNPLHNKPVYLILDEYYNDLL